MSGTTVENITTTAGVAKRVFYEHFTDKEACFVELLGQYSADHLRYALDTAEEVDERSPFDTIRSVIRALVTRRDEENAGLILAIRAEARPGTQLAAAYEEHHRRIADLLVVVAVRLGSALPEQTLRLAALLLVNGVVDLGPELRGRRGVLREVSTIVCLAFGLPLER